MCKFVFDQPAPIVRSRDTSSFLLRARSLLVHTVGSKLPACVAGARAHLCHACIEKRWLLAFSPRIPGAGEADDRG
eukprot:9273806-Pyramimonas_sp.AAC.1